MSGGWVLVALGGWFVVAPVVWAVVWWFRTPPPGPVLLTPEQWEALQPDARDAYLRHPCWPVRCACRAYGMPTYPVVLRTVTGIHEHDRCYPEREGLHRW